MSQKMTLNEKVRQIERQLIASENHVEFRLLRALEDDEARLHSDGMNDLFLLPTIDEQSLEIERIDGLYSMVREYELADGSNQRFLQIRALTEFRAKFSPFIAELLSNDLSNPTLALEDTLKDWRNLWLGSSGKLNWKEQRGLLGELIVLDKLISSGTSGAVNNWVGPLGNTHDFESDFLNLEIKTTTKQPASVQISLIKQVAPMEGSKTLHLIVVGLENGEDFSLVSVVEGIRDALSGTQYVRNFEHVLMKSGYRDKDKSHYSKLYSISFLQKHQITEESPVLNPKIIGEIPATVSNIKYTLDVHGMDMEDLSQETWVNFGEALGG